VTNGKSKRRTNGHAGPQDRTNGHAPASSDRGGISAHGNHAASDDASEASVANAAISAAAGTPRDGHADAAPPHPNGAPDPEDDKNSEEKGKSKIVPPGEGPLPPTPRPLVEEFPKPIDLYKI